MSSLVLPEPNENWTPAYYTKSLNNKTRGDDIIDFAELLMFNPKGITAGEPLVFTDWQKWLARAIFEEKDTGYLRYRYVTVGLARKNGKSLFSTAIALHELMYGVQGGEIYSAAGAKDQARIVFGEARNQVVQNPILKSHLKVYRDAIENPNTGSIYRVLSADGDKHHGLNPSVAILDELHIFPSTSTNSKGQDLFDTMLSGSGARPESLVIGITTAGSNTDSLLGRLYEQGKRISEGETENSSTGFFWWESPADALPSDREAWKKANPNLAEGLMDESYLESQLERAEGTGFSSFQRLHMNQWVRQQGEDFVNPHFWDEAQVNEKVPLGASVTLGFDGAMTGDCTALVAQDVNTGLLKVISLWEPDPSDPDWAIDTMDVDAAVHKAFKDYDVKMLWCDPAYYRAQIEEWGKTYRNRVQIIPFSNSRIIPLAQQFLTDLISNEIKHDGDPALTRHVKNAVATEGGSFRKEKAKSPRKIDLLVASVLANGARQQHNSKPKITRRNIIL
jgi:phage terminase large subunit-like protein